MTVPAWRVAWRHSKRGKWVLGLYEYRDLGMAVEMLEWMRAESPGVKAELIPCQAETTGHGVQQ